MVTSIDTDITFEGLSAEMRDICRFDEQQPFTMKWVDEEGKPCHISEEEIYMFSQHVGKPPSPPPHSKHTHLEGGILNSGQILTLLSIVTFLLVPTA